MPAAETPVAYLGIDVGKSSHSACALDAGGGVAFRAELANRPDDIDRLPGGARPGAPSRYARHQECGCGISVVQGI